jgi:hypothetical protein
MKIIAIILLIKSLFLLGCASQHRDPYAAHRLTPAQVAAHNARVSGGPATPTTALSYYPGYSGITHTSYTRRSRFGGRTTIENDLNPLESYTVRSRSGGATIEHDFDPLESYTLRNRGGGRSTIEHDFDPLRSYSVRHRGGGRAIIENDLNPLESYTVRPRAGGGYTIEDDFNPLKSIDVDER